MHLLVALQILLPPEASDAIATGEPHWCMGFLKMLTTDVRPVRILRFGVHTEAWIRLDRVTGM
jgi:hypothetical protein